MAKHKEMSMIERQLKDPAFRAAFEREAAALEISEFIAEKMAERDVSVRKLAALSGISATVIQGIKSGSRKNIQYNTLRPIIAALGCRIVFAEAAAKQKRTRVTA